MAEINARKAVLTASGAANTCAMLPLCWNEFVQNAAFLDVLGQINMV